MGTVKEEIADTSEKFDEQVDRIKEHMRKKYEEYQDGNTSLDGRIKRLDNMVRSLHQPTAQAVQAW